MDQIRPWLYVGKYRETLDRHLLAAHGIGAMLLLAEPVEQPGIAMIYLEVEDFAPIPVDVLRRGVGFVRAQKQQGQRVLVACGAGINRSAAFCVAVLVEEEGLGLTDAFAAVKAKHPESLPHPPVWHSLTDYYQQDVPFHLLLARTRE